MKDDLLCCPLLLLSFISSVASNFLFDEGKPSTLSLVLSCLDHYTHAITPPKDLVDVYRRLTPVALSGAGWDDYDDDGDLLYKLLSPL